MEVRVTVAGADAADQLRSLREWLGHTPELRGRVAAVEGPPLPGTLGPVLDAVAILLAPGGVAAALAPAVLSWLRDRRGEVTVRITRPDGSRVELSATRVAGLTGAELRTQAERLVHELEAAGDAGDSGDGNSGGDGDDGDEVDAAVRRPEGSANP